MTDVFVRRWCDEGRSAFRINRFVECLVAVEATRAGGLLVA